MLKKYWEGGEHYSWISGQELLIDTNNNVLVDDFSGMYDTPSVSETITSFSYIYDSLKNWICKISMQDNKINMITQREFQY